MMACTSVRLRILHLPNPLRSTPLSSHLEGVLGASLAIHQMHGGVMEIECDMV